METGGVRAGAPDVSGRRVQLGTNQSGMRALNERLVLSLVRRHGRLAKSDIARLTRLSAQTVSVIMRELERAGLLPREEPVRGRVGQPSVPMSLNPEGAFFIGLKIGRRSAELVLIDFVGNVRRMLRKSYTYPEPGETIAFVRASIAAVREGLTPEQNARIEGLGIAMPFELWNWADAVGAPREAMDGWRHIDIRAEIGADLGFPIYLQNDATAACGAELVFGSESPARDFIYFYIGAFAGGGVVLDGKLYAGSTGNAGALGSMPVPGPDGRTVQLIDVASVTRLEKALIGAGRPGGRLWTDPDDWQASGPELDRWIREAGSALAHAVVAATSVIDFEAAVVEGWMPGDVRRRLVETVREALGTIDIEGLELPDIREGTVGIHARALGGASLPLSERFLIGATLPED